MNEIQKRALHALFNDHYAPFADLVRSNEKAVHVQNIERLIDLQNIAS